MEIQFKNGFPTKQGIDASRADELRLAAVTAYRFWYPTVSCEGIFTGNREIGIRDNEAFSYMTASPVAKGFTPNEDTPYAIGVLDLKKNPILIEIPAGPYIGVIDDHHQRWITDLGIPGVYGARGGKHIIIPPDYEGDVLDGYEIAESQSYKVLVALRVLPENGDVEKALERLKEIKIYDLKSNKEILRSTNFVNLSGKEGDFSCLSWEDNFQFWRKLKLVIDEEPMVDEFKTMYGHLSLLGIEKGKPFNPDAGLTDILEAASVEGRNQLLMAGYASERPDRFPWKDRKWEWIGLVSDNADFETDHGIDLEARERWFGQAILTSPAMFRRKEGAGSLYWLGLRDEKGQYLDGSKTYKLRIQTPVPAKLFWSITVYDNKTRSLIQTEQNRAAVRSLFELKDIKTDYIEVFFGPVTPKGKESVWIQTLPNQGWFSYFRIYGPERDAFTGAWRLNDFEEVGELH